MPADELGAFGRWFAANAGGMRFAALVREAEADVVRVTGCDRAELDGAASAGDDGGRPAVIGRWMDHALNERRKRVEADPTYPDLL